MIRELRLERFKSFEDATLKLGPFSVLVGTNASGKSNVRDAFRFLHGIGRGYMLAEILGEKWLDSGVLAWSGIRGGPREICFVGKDTFALTVALDVAGKEIRGEAEYHIEVRAGQDGEPSRVVAERL